MRHAPIELVKRWLGIGSVTVAVIVSGVGEAIGTDVWEEIKGGIAAVQGSLTEIETQVEISERSSPDRSKGRLGADDDVIDKLFTTQANAESAEARASAADAAVDTRSKAGLDDLWDALGMRGRGSDSEGR